MRQIEGSLNKDSTYDQLETTLGTLLGAAANLDAVAKASLWMALMQVGETDGVGSITGRLIAEQNYTTLATYLTRNGTQASILTAQPNDQTGVNSSQDGTVLQLNSIWKFKVKFGGKINNEFSPKFRPLYFKLLDNGINQLKESSSVLKSN